MAQKDEITHQQHPHVYTTKTKNTFPFRTFYSLFKTTVHTTYKFPQNYSSKTEKTSHAHPILWHIQIYAITFFQTFIG